MQQKILNDILSIIKNQKLDDVLKENEGIRKNYCYKILKSDTSFFIKSINNNLYDYLRDFYILKKDVTNKEELKMEELEIIKKYVIYNNLKKLDRNSLERLKVTNDILQYKNMTKKVETNKEYRSKIIEFIKLNDYRFYSMYIQKYANLQESIVQINMVKEYNEYLKNIS